MDLKLGRRAPKRKVALQFRKIWTGVIPEHPTQEDYASYLGGWEMLGNDKYGDCVAVSWANIVRLVTAFLTQEDYPTMDQVEAIYKTQNLGFPADDNGMDIQTLLEYLVKHGGPDGRKLVAFAQLDVSNPEEIEAAQAIFGAPMLGIIVTEANMKDFDNGNPWSYHPNSRVLGGHAVLMGGYDKNGYKFVSWAEETSMDLTYVTSPHLEEAWVLIWPEHLGTKAFQQGVDVNALAADYLALTGNPLPIPSPVPVDNPPAPIPYNGQGCLLTLLKRISGK